MELGRFGSGIISAHSIVGLRNSARRPAKDAVRPGTMPGSARDTPKPKRKRKGEPVEAMAQECREESASADKAIKLGLSAKVNDGRRRSYNSYR